MVSDYCLENFFWKCWGKLSYLNFEKQEIEYESPNRELVTIVDASNLLEEEA